MFYVKDGLSQSSANFTTAKGGSVVRVRPASTEDDYFRYKPAANYIGVDTFEYYFEIWNDQNILLARSNTNPIFYLCSAISFEIQRQASSKIFLSNFTFSRKINDEK